MKVKNQTKNRKGESGRKRRGKKKEEQEGDK
jgi:hypothetical protein